MSNVERNNRIILRRARGSSISQVAAVEGISVGAVRYILSRHQFCISERVPPPGLSVRSAWCIEQVFGIWPSESNAEEIAGRMIEFLRAPGSTMRIWREIEGWIDSLHHSQAGKS
ncbi:hypothetical protein [Pseudorhizobium marinum]|uniref:hypothetical protein n=1 Tax=Pseudorhizobium marinum TaxID=1496690 RepID=UPI0004954FFD|nr:hypothetical protein [Pseudorhizobium marinum]